MSTDLLHQIGLQAIELRRVEKEAEKDPSRAAKNRALTERDKLDVLIANYALQAARLAAVQGSFLTDESQGGYKV